MSEQTKTPVSHQNTKVQNKIVNFLEFNSKYHNNRQEFIKLHKEYRELPEDKKPKDEVQEVQKQMNGGNGSQVVVVQNVKRKVYPSTEVEELFNKLKDKRKNILRFNKQSTIYVNMLCDKIIEDFIHSCEPLNKGKKSQEKTLGWKQFDNREFAKRFTYSFIKNSRYFNEFLDVRNLIIKFSNEKEMIRIKYDIKKANTTTVIQDIQKMKQLRKQNETLNDDALKEKLRNDLGDDQWADYLENIFLVLQNLQSNDEESKLLFNNVKNVVTKQLKNKDVTSVEGVTGTTENKPKIAHDFKFMISKIIRQMLLSLTYKIEVYLENTSNKQIKLNDIKKITRLWVNFDDLDELKTQLDQFDSTVDAKLLQLQQQRSTQDQTVNTLESSISTLEQVVNTLESTTVSV